MRNPDTVDLSEQSEGQYVHWADIVADTIIKTKLDKEGNPKPLYTCASGITPSGVVHIGNFREIISVELVVRALRDRGKKVRFLYSWDDYDVFRKVPKNMPKPELLGAHLRWPIVMVPDPFGEAESYARHHELAVEKSLPSVGIAPEYLYQAKNYRASTYAKMIRFALENREKIRAILNDFRTEDDSGARTLLGDDWWPISAFSRVTNKDTTTILGWDGDWKVRYRCDESKQEIEVDLRECHEIKLPWRIDWPMRWTWEGVDFEPAGKDHHSEGGSWSTAERISKEVFGHDAPVTFRYDFISLKGRDGKMSSSKGDVVDINDVTEIYTPELARYLFAGTRPGTEFHISFDLDVIKIYEDFDKTERIYYGIEPEEGRKLLKEKRIYELSQVKQGGVLPFMPLQIPFRHLCNLLLIRNGDIEKAIAAFPGTDEARAKGQLDDSPAGQENMQRARVRAACAWNWIQRFAPEDFKFSLRMPGDGRVDLSAQELQATAGLRGLVEAGVEDLDDKALQDRIYQIARDAGMEPKAFFGTMYRILIGKQQGPRLASFIKTLGKQHVIAMIDASHP